MIPTSWKSLSTIGLALVALSSVSLARHVHHRQLQPMADALHRAAIQFEAKACQRPFPRHEQIYIGVMTKKACRLADGIRSCSSYGRINADTIVMKAFIRVVDRRLARHCATRYDYDLMQCWAQVKHHLAGIRCGLDGCCNTCVYHHPPRPVVPPRPHHQPIPRHVPLPEPVQPAPAIPPAPALPPAPRAPRAPAIDPVRNASWRGESRRNDTAQLLIGLLMRSLESRANRDNYDRRNFDQDYDRGNYDRGRRFERRF